MGGSKGGKKGPDGKDGAKGKAAISENKGGKKGAEGKDGAKGKAEHSDGKGESGKGGKAGTAANKGGKSANKGSTPTEPNVPVRCASCTNEAPADANFCLVCGHDLKAYRKTDVKQALRKEAEPIDGDTLVEELAGALGIQPAAKQAPAPVPAGGHKASPDAIKLVPEYPSRDAQELCRSVGEAVDCHYGNLIGRLRRRVRDYRMRCDFAADAASRWVHDRDSLVRDGCDWKVKADTAKLLANYNKVRFGTEISEASPPPTRSGSVQMKALLEKSTHADLQQLEMKDVTLPEIDGARSRFLAFVERNIPLRSEIKSITESYGSACGALFHFYSYLLLISIIGLLCYIPLILAQFVENTQLRSDMCGEHWQISCIHFLGGFYKQTGPAAERWEHAVGVERDPTTQELTVTRDMGPSSFDEMYYRCPIVRYVRDCRVMAVFAGFVDSSTSPHEVFSKSWSSLAGRQNKDWVIFDGFSNLVQSTEAWLECNPNETEAWVGFPGRCGPSGTTEAHLKFAFSSETSRFPPAEHRPAFGSRLELFNGSQCPVQSRQDVRDRAGGVQVLFRSSGKDPWLAWWYFLAALLSSSLANVLVISWWAVTEETFRLEVLMQKLKPLRWSSKVLGLLNFRIRSEEDRRSWHKSLAEDFRCDYNEEHAQEMPVSQRRILRMKRVLGVVLTLLILAGWAAAIWQMVLTQSEIRSTLRWMTPWTSEGTRNEFVGALGSFVDLLGIYSTYIVISMAGSLLAPMSKLLTRLEAWQLKDRVILDIYRVYIGKVILATVYLLFVFEVFLGQRIWREDRLMIQPLTRPCGPFTCKEDQAGMELLSLAMIETIFLFLKHFFKIAFVGAEFCLRRLVLRSDSNFEWPEFQIANNAVDVLYLSTLLLIATPCVPSLSLIHPILLFVTFKFFKMTLKRLARQPFAVHTSEVIVALHRLTCLSYGLISLLQLMLTFTVVPCEAHCSPIDGYQALSSSLFKSSMSMDGHTSHAVSRPLITCVLLLSIAVLGTYVSAYRRTDHHALDLMHTVEVHWTTGLSRSKSRLEQQANRLEQQANLLERRASWMEAHALHETG